MLDKRAVDLQEAIETRCADSRVVVDDFEARQKALVGITKLYPVGFWEVMGYVQVGNLWEVKVKNERGRRHTVRVHASGEVEVHDWLAVGFIDEGEHEGEEIMKEIWRKVSA